ncbi:uncharacterized protein [Tiliqua scincoides]|uniref:uncharacterized protein n=1 Tax=Tiliqua scincoides TaxID=71010 RepID=UPI003463693E
MAPGRVGGQEGAALPQTVGLLSIAAGEEPWGSLGAAGPAPPRAAGQGAPGALQLLGCSFPAGSLLQAAHRCPLPAAQRGPRSALGVLLLLLAPLLALAGAPGKSRQPRAPLLGVLCTTVAALWGGCGALQILAGQGLLRDGADLHSAAVPGLAALGLGLLLTGLAGFLRREAALGLLASALALACALEVAAAPDDDASAAALACSHLLAGLAGGYVALGRRCFLLLRRETLALPGARLAKGQSPGSSAGADPLAPASLILNMLSASVFSCRLLGVTSELSAGQVPWLWAGGVCQLGIALCSFRAGGTLAATSSALTSLLKFTGGCALLLRLWLPEEPLLPMPPLLALATLFGTLAFFTAIGSLADGLYLLFYVAFCVALACCPGGFWASGPQAVTVAILGASSFLTLLHLCSGNFRVKSPQVLLSHLCLCKLQEGEELHAPCLGSSKYADAEALGYAGSMLAALAMTVVGEPKSPLATVTLPWVVVAGGILALLSGSVAFSRGKTLESGAFILYGSTWLTCGLARYGGLYGTAHGFQVAVGTAPLLLLNACVVLGALALSISWLAYSLAFQLILLSFLLDAAGSLPAGYDTAASVVFGLVGFYCFLSALVNSTFEYPKLPVGRPLVRLQGSGEESAKCLHLPARRASAVKQVAELMKKGGACGIPTDTVYVLAAACSRPDAVEKAYGTKRHARDRPMSLWISSLRQLEPARPLFSPLLWEFMETAWPSPISLVVPRGEWVDCLGLEDSAKYVGTPQSVAIRIPDCSIATHLIDLVGPITVTSANPTGEADTTHHNQVYAQLGDKVDAVLCDGPSPETVASTVVDCTKIESSGTVGFFRVGIVPESQVLQILEQVQRRHQPGHVTGTVAPEGSAEQQTLP